MSFTVNQASVEAGADIYYDQGFRQTIEVFLDYLINHVNTQAHTVTHDLVSKYRADFYGLLGAISFPVPMHLRWIVLRMNGYTNPNQFAVHLRRSSDDVYYETKESFTILIPDSSEIERLRSRYLTMNQ